MAESTANKKKRRGGSWKPGRSGNPAGAPKRGESWAEIIKQIGDMTVEEVKAMIVRWLPTLKAAPPEMTLKQAVVTRAFVALLNEPSASMLNALMDRAEGKVQEKVDVTSDGERLAFDYGRFINSATRPVQDRDASSENKSDLHGASLGQNDDVRGSGA